jgi:hypothetical protein
MAAAPERECLGRDAQRNRDGDSKSIRQLFQLLRPAPRVPPELEA